MAEGLEFTDQDLARTLVGASPPQPQAAGPGDPQAGFSDADLAKGFVAAPSAPIAAPSAPMTAGAAGPPPGGYVAGLARLIGQGALANWSDEALAKVREIAGGEKYDEALADERARVAAFRKANPKAAMAAELGGAFLTPGLGVAAGALRAPTTLGRMAQAGKAGAAYGAASGAGSADEGSRTEGAIHGGLVGGAVAPLFPLVGKAFSAPAGKIGDFISGTKISMAPAEAAADTALMRGMQRQGTTPGAVRANLAEADRLGTYYTAGVDKAGNPLYSRTESPVAIADYVPKVAGQITRASPQVQQEAQTFFKARQTGQIPPTAEGQAFLANKGLNTRDMMGRADMAHGEPAGQYERTLDALKRGFTLIDTKFHGHQPNTYLTFQALAKEGKANADKLYGEARAAAKGVDLAPEIQPVIDAIKKRIKSPETGRTDAGLLRQLISQFTVGGKTVNSLNAIDGGKRAIDAIINEAKRKGNTNIGRVLLGDEAKGEHGLKAILDRVGKIKTNDIGDKYNAARGQFSSDHELLDAIEFGRGIRKANINEATVKFDELSDIQKKLARLGLIEDMHAAGLDRARTEDLTRVYETPRMQELLRKMVPMSEKESGVFGDRPQRVYGFMQNERMMADTPRKVYGNSMTTERLADDAAFTRETLSSMVERFRGIPSVTNMAIEVASMAVNKTFGYREDVARALSKRLFTANRAEQHALLTRLEGIWGKDPVSRLVRLIDGTMTAIGVGTAGASSSSSPRKLPQGSQPAVSR